MARSPNHKEGSMSETTLVTSWTVDLRRSRTANGGWEWYFMLGSTPLYPNPAQVGVFTDPDVPVEDAFRRVLAAWKIMP